MVADLLCSGIPAGRIMVVDLLGSGIAAVHTMIADIFCSSAVVQAAIWPCISGPSAWSLPPSQL